MRRYQPLRGVRVLAFEAAFSLPSGTRTLAELGADVVRVGRPARGTPRARYITVVDGGGLSKSSLGLNLAREEGRGLARELVARADVVCNNFRPRVMQRFGLDRDALWAIKPDLIILQLTGYGTPGPWQDYPAYGPSTEAAGGLNYLMGEASDPPIRVGSGVFADQAGGRYAALALIAALLERRRTGKGRFIDVSMAEGITHLLGDVMLEAAATGLTPPRHGNRDPHIAPQGIYPCQPTVPTSFPAREGRGDRGTARGPDRDGGSPPSAPLTSGAQPQPVGERREGWIALSIVTDAQWRALVSLIEDPALQDERYATADGRRCDHDRIDARIAAWTRGYDKQALAELLQAHGIPAGPVQDTSDLPYDPHLAARGAFHMVRHRRPVLGSMAHPHLTTPWRAAGYGRAALRDYNGDGAENRPVLQRWLGLAVREVTRLERAGVLERTPWSPLPDLVAEPGVPVDSHFGRRLGLPPAQGAE